MGYYLYITRAGEWTDSTKHPISSEEWLGLVDTHPQIEQDVRNGPLDHIFTCADGTTAYLGGSKGWRRSAVPTPTTKNSQPSQPGSTHDWSDRTRRSTGPTAVSLSRASHVIRLRHLSCDRLCKS